MTNQYSFGLCEGRKLSFVSELNYRLIKLRTEASFRLPLHSWSTHSGFLNTDTHTCAHISTAQISMARYKRISLPSKEQSLTSLVCALLRLGYVVK